MVGSVEQYPNETSAQKAVAALRADINAENPRTSLTPISVQTLVEHYREKELGANCSKTRKTQVTYVGLFPKVDFASLGKLSRHRGQGSRCRAVASVAQVCEWKQSQSSKHHECGFQSRCQVGMARCESHTHGASKRQADQDAHCAFHRADCGTASHPEGAYAHDGISRRVHGPSGWGVARPQVEGLSIFRRWRVHVIRSIVMQHVGDCKTEASRKPVPLDLRLSKVLWNWRLHSPYPTDEDWVFASPHSGGKLPYWPGSLYKAHLEPAAKEIGIVGHFGWHTFRHTYATLLKGNGEDVKVVQELMRHANISVTLNVYAQAITQTKRDAQSRVVSLLLDKNEEKPSTEAYRTVTDLQNSGGDLQVVDKVGVPDGI